MLLRDDDSYAMHEGTSSLLPVSERRPMRSSATSAARVKYFFAKYPSPFPSPSMPTSSIALKKMAQAQEGREFLESLCDLQVPDSIKFSVNAQQIVYSTTTTWEHKKGKDSHVTSTLWLAETGKPGSSRQLTSGLFKDHSPQWHPNGQSIAFISDRPAAGKKWAIYILNLRNGAAEGEAYPLTDVENEQEISNLAFDPTGDRIAWIAADQKTSYQKARDENGEDWQVWGEDWTYSHLHTVVLATKAVSTIQVTGGANEKDRHIRQLDWSPDGKSLAIVHTASPHIEEPFYTGSRISVVTLQGSGGYDVCEVTYVAEDLLWAGDGNLYFWSEATFGKSEAGTSAYAVEAKPNSKPNKIAFGVENDVRLLSKIGSEVVAGVEHGMESRVYLLPDRLLFSKAQGAEAFAAAYSTDSDEILIAIGTSDINHPDEVYTTTASGGGLVQLSNHGAVFKDKNFGTCTHLTCPTTDNKAQLDNLFLAPLSVKEGHKALPTVVLVHGGPFSRNVNSFNTYYYFWTPYLLSLGYGILLVNYRGSSGKGGEFATSTQGTNDYQDVVAATQHAIESGHADKDRLIVGGVSQGGFLSYLCSVRNGDHGFGWKFKASIPVSGVTDTDAMALTSDLGGTLEMELNDGRAPWTLDKHDTRNRDASALYEFHAAMERSRKTGEMVVPPMLILHGEKDERCPLTQAWGMRRALMHEKLPFEMVTYPRQPHLIQESRFWIDMAERIGRWCEKYIGPGEK